MELSPHSLSPPMSLDGIRSLVGVGSLVGPLVHPVLYRHQPPREAIPKYLSGRTSYHRIRLAFHSYPQLIPQVFNLEGFGPPPAGKPVSPWPWVAHPASGLLHATRALFRLAFATAPPHGLTWLRRVTRRPIMQKVRSRPDGWVAPAITGLPPLVATRFQVLFHSPHRGAFHLSLTVLVHYRSLASI